MQDSENCWVFSFYGCRFIESIGRVKGGEDIIFLKFEIKIIQTEKTLNWILFYHNSPIQSLKENHTMNNVYLIMTSPMSPFSKQFKYLRFCTCKISIFHQIYCIFFFFFWKMMSLSDNYFYLQMLTCWKWLKLRIYCLVESTE